MELPSSGLTDMRALVHVAIDNDPLRSLPFLQKRYAPDILASWTLDPSGDFIVGAFARIPPLDVLLPSNVRSTRGPLNLFGGGPRHFFWEGSQTSSQISLKEATLGTQSANTYLK